VDTDKDPYSINKGFWFAHILWMFDGKKTRRDSSMAKSYSRDLDKDALIVWQDKHYYSIAIFSCFIFPTILGWAFFGSPLGGLLFGGVLRMVLVHHATFFINSLCHFWGRRPYTDENTARDNLVAAIFTFGEGYHNFHHIFHADYRNGIKWYQYDPTKWMIKTLAYLRMVRDLKITPEYEIFKAKMIMAEKNLRNRKQVQHVNIEKILETIKHKAEDAHARWVQLRAEYETMKHNLHVHGEEKLRAVKRDINLAKLEFRAACAQWRVCVQHI
jgi:stearoyl-CoA desaturase (delta-9 desaturase)